MCIGSSPRRCVAIPLLPDEWHNRHQWTAVASLRGFAQLVAIAATRKVATSRGQAPDGPSAAHCSRRALTMFIRTARIAGNSPPSTPIVNAMASPCSSTFGPKRNANVISLKVDQLAVPVDIP